VSRVYKRTTLETQIGGFVLKPEAKKLHREVITARARLRDVEGGTSARWIRDHQQN
jgi:hypothetical protein